MFSRLSRYRTLPEVHAVDAAGRRLASAELRLLPATPGSVRHSVEAGDRLDHLAYKYYRQPTRWWRICDANPELLSPLELLAEGPLATVRLPLGYGGEGAAPWPELVRRLLATPGVDEVTVEDSVAELVTVETTIDTETVSFERSDVRRAVVVRYHRHTVTPEALSEVVAAAGFEPGPAQAVGRVGKDIVLPPRTLGG